MGEIVGENFQSKKEIHQPNGCPICGHNPVIGVGYDQINWEIYCDNGHLKLSMFGPSFSDLIVEWNKIMEGKIGKRT